MSCLNEEFYEDEVTVVACSLLGKRLVRSLEGTRLAGIITETEAYRGEEDLACHARSGKTQRNAVMYGRPGRAYTYFTYGMHWCFNVVCGPEGFPAAVLIRAIHPVEGLETIAARRPGRKAAESCNGPARLCKALGIDNSMNGVVLCDDESPLWIEEGMNIPVHYIEATPRVGIAYAPEPWRTKSWRFVINPQQELIWC